MRFLLVVALLFALSFANDCKEGECCDLKTNTLKPAGEPCGTDPCREALHCTGTNPYCPTGGKMRVNGTACPEGVCFNGKCKQATVCVNDCCDDKKVAHIDGYPCAGGQCIDGKCKTLPECIGSCCDESGNAKADGVACPEGNCMLGMCTNLQKRCTVGHCCDVHKKILRPKGFKCTNNPCAVKTECSGTSEFCPKPTHFVVDGTPCPTGVCLAGVCLNEPYNATKIAEQQLNEQLVLQKDERTIVAGNLVIHHHHVSLPVCKTGACCDVKKQEVFDKGLNCTAKECFVGVCDGQYSGCEYTTAPAGTPCAEGFCFDGVCVKNCIGMCCDDDDVSPREDGSPCADGFCFRGTCIKTCVGECCEPIELFADTRDEHYRNKRIGHKPNYGKFMQAKVDGSKCFNENGYCVKGQCTAFTVPEYRPTDTNRPEIVPHDADVKMFSDSFRERFVKNFFMAAAKVEKDNMDEEELEYLNRKITEEQNKTKTERDKQIQLKADYEAEMLSAANATASSSWTDKLFSRTTLFYLLVALAAIAVIACIVRIVSSRKGSTKEANYEPLKKQDDDYDF